MRYRRLLLLLIPFLLLLFLRFVPGFANHEGEPSPSSPPEIDCTLLNGTVVHVKAGVELSDLSVEGLCYREKVPAGWNVYCSTSERLPSVVVSFSVGGEQFRTEVVCS
ncbi:MAG: hypothetical protein GXO00_02040 [Candidatus Diapherotrites archaeon]|nr:hypothetical protein [Candidatus Diapherotrites archaeon]